MVSLFTDMPNLDEVAHRMRIPLNGFFKKILILKIYYRTSRTRAVELVSLVDVVVVDDDDKDVLFDVRNIFRQLSNLGLATFQK